MSDKTHITGHIRDEPITGTENIPITNPRQTFAMGKVHKTGSTRNLDSTAASSADLQP